MVSERDKMILEYLPYAKERARYWGRRYPFLKDDIMSVSLLALVQGFHQRVPEHPKGYLSQCIGNAVNDLLEKNNLIHIPRSERQRRKREQEPLDTLPKALLWGYDSEDYQLGKESPIWKILQVDDICLLLELTDREKRIIKLKTDGYTNQEIGVEFNLTEAAIRKAMKNIRYRYWALAYNHPEIIKPYDHE